MPVQKLSNCHLIGKIIKSHGTKGEILLICDKEIDNELFNTQWVFLILDNLPVPFFISSVKERFVNSAVIQFEDINSIAASDILTGAEVWLPLKSKKRLKISAGVNESLSGYSVIDHKSGNIGWVAGILDHPDNPLLEVRKEEKDYLIPFRDEVITEIDHKSKSIYINAPDGLFDL